jgi:hypothetical protein
LILFESKSFPVIKQQGEIYFTEFKIDLNQFGVFSKNLQKKIRKEKTKEKEKGEKGQGVAFRPRQENGSRPTRKHTRNGIPFSHFSPLTGGARLSAPTPSSSSGRKSRAR